MFDTQHIIEEIDHLTGFKHPLGKHDANRAHYLIGWLDCHYGRVSGPPVCEYVTLETLRRYKKRIILERLPND